MFRPARDQMFNRRDARRRRRNLNHQVGTPDAVPQAPDFGNGRLGIVRQLRGDLQADVPVVAVLPVVEEAEHVSGRLDVGHGQRFVNLRHLKPAAHQLANGIVVVGTAGNGLLKNRGVRGHPPQPILVNHALQLTRGQHAPVDVVVPKAVTELV